MAHVMKVLRSQSALSVFLRNLASLYSANIFAKFGAIILVIMAARYLGAEDFGRFSFIVSFTSLGAALTDFGINFYLIRTIARYQNRALGLVSDAAGLKLLLSAAVVVIVWAVSFSPQFSAREALGLRVASLTLALDTLVQQIYAIFRGFQRMHFESLGVSLETIVTVLLGIFLVVSTRNLVLLLSAYLLAKIINLSVLATLSSRQGTRLGFSFDFAAWGKLIKSSLPFALNIFLGLAAFRMDVILLRFVRDPQQVGLYRAALSIVVTVTIFAYMYQAALYPALSRFFVASEARLVEAIRGSLVLLAAIGLLAALVVAQLAKPLVGILFGSSYIPAAQILQVLVVMLPLKFVDQVLGITLDSVDRQNVRPFVAGAAIVSNFLLNYVLIKAFAARGAAAATVLTEALVFLLYSVLVTRFVGKLRIRWALARLVIAAALSLVAMDVASHGGALVQFAAGVITYFFLLYVLGLISELKGFARSFSGAALEGLGA